MRRYGHCSDLKLDFLGRAEMEDYLARRFPQAHFDGSFIDWLADTTDGSPLFVCEYVNLLINEHIITAGGEVLTDVRAIQRPESVEGVIQARIRHLDREAREWLAYASMEGEHFTTLLLSRLLAVEVLPLIRRLRAIEETHQLIASLGEQTLYQRKTTVYRFVHTLVHQSLRGMLQEEERRQISRMLLDIQTELYVSADAATRSQMAPKLMFDAVAAEDHLSVARYALDAAQSDLKTHAYPEVLKECDRGLQAITEITSDSASIGELRAALLACQERASSILALSDPPYYAAYPNPELTRFIEQRKRRYDVLTDDYCREPFAGHIAVRKDDSIYNAHPYPAKIPYASIVPYIEHFTQPGDIVFDGFCGSGSTGLAAQTAGRYAVLCDVSPAATFIAYDFNLPLDIVAFRSEAEHVLADAEQNCGWMYQTRHQDGSVATVEYTVWSDVIRCPRCSQSVILWEIAGIVATSNTELACPLCSKAVTMRTLDRVTESVFDQGLGREIERCVQVPVLIHYSVHGKRYSKRPDDDDLALIHRIDASDIPHWYPTDALSTTVEADFGHNYRFLGISSVHHFYTKRNLRAIAFLQERVRQVRNTRLQHHLLFWLQSVIVRLSRLNAYRSSQPSGRPTGGTLYVAPLTSELSPWRVLSAKIPDIAAAASLARPGVVAITTDSASDIKLPDNSLDYIFTDPPFGANISYSSLNILWESWHKVLTDPGREMIVRARSAEGKSLQDYRALMLQAFTRMYNALKPNRWMTVVFHNSDDTVAESIQDAIREAGFEVGQILAIGQSGEGKPIQIHGMTESRSDIVFSAQKPRLGTSTPVTVDGARS